MPAGGLLLGLVQVLLQREDQLSGGLPGGDGMVQGGGQVGVLGPDNRPTGCPVIGGSGDEQAVGLPPEVGVELVVGLVDGLPEVGLVLNAGAEEVGQHRLDLHPASELRVGGGQPNPEAVSY